MPGKTQPAMSSAALRRAFLDYFRGREHAIVPSAPIVPANDPTLLFTNAGMVQFKDVFLGREQRPYRRAASSQCCVRAGGKHNDLENVGYTARHHTFFEMLGNFSFGDYFKREAIAYAWEFLTGVLGLDPGRLWVTVFEDDDEAAAVWLKDIRVDPERFSRCGEKDNFWTMGPTGPCGPCSEIFYDHGPAIPGGPPGSPVQEGDRYVEVWNLVFTQYDRDEAGRLHPIPRPSVDTGMGLERIAAVMQGVHSNYDIDVFRTLIGAVSEMAGEGGPNPRTSLQVIADHIRSCAFIAAEGVVPANEGRGYVLRRIIRRAIRHGSALGIAGPFFHKLVAPLTREMGETYPILVTAQGNIERVLRQEEERFAETLEQGLKVLERVIAGLRGKVIPGREVFQLYDTYGFPVDLTADIARERGLRLDLDGFEGEMARQRERARAASQFGAAASGTILPVLGGAATTRTPGEFTGYAGTRGEGQVLALYRDGEAVEVLEVGAGGCRGPRPHPFLRRGRRPDRRCRRAARPRGDVPGHGHAEASGAAPAHRLHEERPVGSGRDAAGGGGPPGASRHGAEPLGDPSPARRAPVQHWAGTSYRRARSSPPIGCASTSRTRPRSRAPRSGRSSTWSTRRSAATGRSRPRSCR